MNKTDRSSKTETAFKLFDKNKDGFVTREEFIKARVILFIIIKLEAKRIKQWVGGLYNKH